MLVRVVLAVALFFVIAIPAALRELDALLRGMHRPGDAAYGLASLGGLHPDSTRPKAVVDTWTRWFDDTSQNDDRPGIVRPTTVAHTSIALDTFFVFFYTALLATLLLVAREKTQSPEETQSGNARGPPEVYQRLTGGAFAALGLLVVADLGENLSSWQVIGDRTNHGWYWTLFVASILKWSLLALVLLALVATWLAIGRQHVDGVTHLRRGWAALVACRVQVVLVLAFTLSMLGPEQLSGQATDVVRRWADNLWGAAYPVVLTAALGLIVLASGRWLTERATSLGSKADGSGELSSAPVVAHGLGATTAGNETPAPGSPKPVSGRIAAGLVAFAFVAAGFVAWFQSEGWIRGGSGLYVPLGMIVVFTAMSALTRGLTLEEVAVEPASVVPAILAGLPLVVLGLATIRAGVGEYFFSHSYRTLIVLAIGVVVQLLGWALFFAGRHDSWLATDHAVTPVAQGIVFAATVLAVTLTVGLWANLWGWSAPLGTVGVMAAFLLVAAVVGFWIGLIGEVVPPPGAFLALGFRRIPVLTLLLAWLVIASLVDRKAGYHDVRPLSDAHPPAENLRVAFDNGVQRAGGDGKGGAVPLVFVGAAGGGIRAAFWTDLVLDCVFGGPHKTSCPDTPASTSIFVASGVSGGALGLANYAARQLYPNDATSPTWVDQRLGGELLAPTMAAMLFRDLPNAFWRLNEWDDRAAVLERTWERQWPHGGRALTAGLFANQSALPLLLFNGTSVADGCRFNTSVLDAAVTLRKNDSADDCLSLRRFERDAPGPAAPPCEGSPAPAGCEYVSPAGRAGWAFAATRDAGDYICGKDLRLSTAALLAARFPFVSPSGRMSCNGNTAFIVDGGYFDNTGTSSIVELWQAIEPMVAEHNSKPGATCLVPVLLEIDNHYSEPHGPRRNWRPRELFVPPQTLGKVRDGREAQAREAAALAFGGEEITPGITVAAVDRIAHIFPRAHPGTTAPLGWVLSGAAKRDLRLQLKNRFNVKEIEKTHDWFSRKLSCHVSAQTRPALKSPG